MNKQRLRSGFGRFLGLLLCLSLSLPNPALALREQQTETESGLEEIKLALLDQTDPGKAAVTAVAHRISNALSISSPIAAPTLSAAPRAYRPAGPEAGLEEPARVRVRLKRALLSRFESDLPRLIQRVVVPVLRDNFKKEKDRQRLRKRLGEELWSYAPSLSERESRDFLGSVFEREDWQDALFRWVNVYILLAKKVAMEFTDRPEGAIIQLLPVAGYELLQIPESDMPLPVIYTGHPLHNMPDTIGSSYRGVAFVRVRMDTPSVAARLTRLEEVSHAVDYYRFREWNKSVGALDALDEFLERIGLLPSASLGDFFISEFARGEPLSAWNNLRELRAFLRGLALEDTQAALELEPASVANLGPAYRIQGYVWAMASFARVLRKDPYLFASDVERMPGRFAAQIKPLVRPLWEREFDPVRDPIELRAELIDRWGWAPSTAGLEEWQGHMDRVQTALRDRTWSEFLPLYREAAALGIRSLRDSVTNPQLSRGLNQLLRESYIVPRAEISDRERGQLLGVWQTNALTYLFLTSQVEEETARLFLQDPERELYFWYYNHMMWNQLTLHMPIGLFGLRGQWEAHLWMDSLALLMAQSPRTSPEMEVEAHRPEFWANLTPSLTQNLSRGETFFERSPKEVLSAGNPSATMRQQVEALGPVSQELKVAVLLRKNDAAYNLAAVYSGLMASTATEFGYAGTSEVWRRAAVARYNQARLENPDGVLWVPPGHYSAWQYVDVSHDAADDLSAIRPSEADSIRKAERAVVLQFFHSQGFVQPTIQQLGADVLDPIVENPQNVAALLEPVINSMRRSKQTGVRSRVGSIRFREGLQRALAEVRRDAQARLGKSMNLGEYKDWAVRIISEERWAELDSASEVAIGILSEWRNSSKPFGQVVQQSSESLRALDQLVRAELGRPAMGLPADPAQRIAIQRWVASVVALLTVSNRLSSRTANAFLQDSERLEGYLWRVLDLFWKDFIRSERAAEFGLQLPPEIILLPSQVNEASSLWLDATQLLRFSTTFEQDDLERGDYEQAQVQIPAQVWPGMIADYDRTRQASRVPSANWIHAHRQLLGQLQGAIPLPIRRAFLLREFSAVGDLSSAFHDYVAALARSQNLSEAAQVFDQMAQSRYAVLSRVSPNFSIWKPSLTAGLEEIRAISRELLTDLKVSDPLTRNGRVSLTSRLNAAGYGGRAMVVSDSASVEGGHVVVAPANLRNPRARALFPWVEVPSRDPAEIFKAAKGAGARPGDLILLDAASGLKERQIQKLLATNGLQGVRVVVGTPSEVAKLPPAAFNLFAGLESSLPPVIFLDVATGLEEKAGITHTLLLMN